jgi:glycosyltransferase involved in cell wall biosynthesis
MSRRVLMVAYYFPPLGGSGTLRTVKLAKYLPRAGWDPVVLAPRNPDWYYASDPGLLTELPPSVEIERSTMLRAAWLCRMLNPLRLPSVERLLRRYVLHPDPQIGWVPGARQLGLARIRRGGIHALFSTSAPMSAHLIALALKRATGLPWVADFRDEWYENPDLAMPTPLHRRLHYRLEARVVREADHVIAAAPAFCRLLAKHRGAARCDPVLMGYDPEDFGTAGPHGVLRSGRFILAFAGLFYASFRPTALLQALGDLLRASDIPPDGFRLRFVGANAPDDVPAALPPEVVEFTGFLPHAEALAQLAAADALLLLLSRERGRDVIPSKTFEYLAAGKPILALVPPDGAVAEILKRTGGAAVVDIRDRDGIRHALRSLYRAWQRGEPCLPRHDTEVAAYRQGVQAAKLAAILDGLVNGPAGLR